MLLRVQVTRLAPLFVAAALLHAPAYAQTPEDAGPSPAAEPEAAQTPRLPDDIRAFASAPLRWRGREWLKFAGVFATVGVAYHYDDKVHEHFANDGEPNYHEVADAMPSAFVFGGMWFAAKLAHNEEARWESSVMRRAIVLETLGSEVMKVAFRRKRPGPGRAGGSLGRRRAVVPVRTHGDCVCDRHGARGVGRRQTALVAPRHRLRTGCEHRLSAARSRCALAVRYRRRRRARASCRPGSS